jgi:D-alanine-D-alanine ligase
MSRSSPPLRIVVLHNSDYSNCGPDDDVGFSARADVENAAQGVADALVSRGHRADVVGIDLPEIAEVIDAVAGDPPDLVFNLCESLRGDSRHEVVVPSLLELIGVPYTGSGPTTLGLALRKDRTKVLLRARGVPTPEGQVLETPGDECRLPFPLIVKPTREDASVGISSSSVVHDPAALAAAVKQVNDELSQSALVERYVEGRELYVSLLGNAPPEPFPLHEIDFSAMPDGLPNIVTYNGKWEPTSQEFLGTRPTRCNLDETVRLRVVRAAREAFDALELSDYGRVDIRLARDNTPYVIDVNPNCDLTDGAGFSRAAGYGGMSYPALIERVCLVALERHRNVRHRAPNLNTEARPSPHARAAGEAAASLRSRPTSRAAPTGRTVRGERGSVRARADRRRAR